MKLDRYQEHAVRSDEKNMVIIAPPGSGKTTVILNRIKFLIEEKRINPNNIITITFTKAAAVNMKERYIAENGNGKVPFFGTFHGLFYKLLGRHNKNIKLIDPGEGYRVVERVLSKTLAEISEEKVKEVLNNISNYKCSHGSGGGFKSSIDENLFMQCYNAYEENKNEKGMIDFDDLQLEFRKLLYEDENIRRGYQRLFKHILVDEFQDCDAIQIEILQLLNKNNYIFAVGDEDQCIYSFRGSQPECMLQFDKYFSDGEKKYLSYNYRSTENIVEYSKRIIAKNKMRNNKKFEAFRHDKGELFYNIPFNEEQQCSDIISKIKKYVSLGDKLSDNVVIYRTNVESRSLIDGFIKENIFFSFLDKDYNFFDHFVCQDILSYLKLSVDPYDIDAFIRIINKPFRYISKTALEEVRRSAGRGNNFDILKDIDYIKPFQKKKIDDLKIDISGLNRMSLKTAIDFVLSTLGYNDYLVEYAMKYKLNIDEIFNIVDEFKSAAEGYNSINMLLAHVEETNQRLEDIKKDKTRDSVLFSTIHGVKGREFKNVFIIDVAEDFIPYRTNDNIEEERRLFYVGVTRAINNLYIYSPKMINGKFRNSSVFITEVNADDFNIKSEDRYKGGDKVTHKSFGEGTVISIEGENISILFNDKIKRTFNINVLERNNLIEKRF